MGMPDPIVDPKNPSNLIKLSEWVLAISVIADVCQMLAGGWLFGKHGS